MESHDADVICNVWVKANFLSRESETIHFSVVFEPSPENPHLMPSTQTGVTDFTAVR